MNEDLAKRVTDKRSPEEADVGFLSHPVQSGNMDTVCNRMTPLDKFPCFLPVTFSRYGAGGMANRSRVKNNFCPVKGNTAGCFGEPLVIADEHRDTAVPGSVNLIPAPGIEVSLLKKTRVLRNVDFVVGGMEGAIRIDDNCAVIEPATGRLLIERHDNNNIMLACNFGKCVGGFSGDRFCKG